MLNTTAKIIGTKQQLAYLVEVAGDLHTLLQELPKLDGDSDNPNLAGVIDDAIDEVVTRLDAALTAIGQ